MATSVTGRGRRRSRLRSHPATARPALAPGHRWALLAVLVVGFALRVAWAAYAARQPGTLSDPAFYLFHGNRISLGLGYTLFDGPTAYYPVGYPAALAASFWLVAHSPLPDWQPGVGAALNVVLGTASVGLAFEAGRRAFGDVRAALVAAAVVAVLPALVLHAGVLLTETLFNALVGVALVVALGDLVAPSRRRLVALGVLLALATYVRPIAVLLLPVLGFVWWRAGAARGVALRRSAVATLALALTILPWTVRNVVVMDAPVLLSTNTGDNLCMSRQPGATGAFLLTEHCFGGYDGLVRPEYELERDRGSTRLAVEFLRERPLEEVRLWFSRTRWTFANGHDALDAAEAFGEDRFVPSRWRVALVRVADASFWATCAAGAVGLALALRSRPPASRRSDPGRLLVALAPVALFLPTIVFFGDPRFAVPLLPFFALGVGALVPTRPRRTPGS